LDWLIDSCGDLKRGHMRRLDFSSMWGWKSNRPGLVIARGLDWVCKWERIARACGGARRWLSSSPPWREAEEMGEDRTQEEDNVVGNFPFHLFFYYLINLFSSLLLSKYLFLSLLSKYLLPLTYWICLINIYTPPI
jgi:hypothetical protein